MQNCANLAELEQRTETHTSIYLKILASIQPLERALQSLPDRQPTIAAPHCTTSVMGKGLKRLAVLALECAARGPPGLQIRI